jgi:hypothetical protein
MQKMGLSNYNKGCWNKQKWNKPQVKEYVGKEVKRDMSKVKCFNCDLYGHLAKAFPKLPWVNEIST